MSERQQYLDVHKMNRDFQSVADGQKALSVHITTLVEAVDKHLNVPPKSPAQKMKSAISDLIHKTEVKKRKAVKEMELKDFQPDILGVFEEWQRLKAELITVGDPRFIDLEERNGQEKLFDDQKSRMEDLRIRIDITPLP